MLERCDKESYPLLKTPVEPMLTPDEVETVLEAYRDNRVDEMLYKAIERRVKEEPVNTRLILLTGVSSMTENPINLALSGKPLTSKSYMTVNILGFSLKTVLCFFLELHPAPSSTVEKDLLPFHRE